MSLLGPQGLFVFSALSLLGFTLGIAIRRKSHEMPIVDETEPFRPVSVTSPVIFELDPRMDEDALASSETDSGGDMPPDGPVV